MNKTNKPRFFISSTTSDFFDLRSAIKFFLEEHGCIVYVAENTDFPVNQRENAYHSCKSAIDCSDFFLLFVGHNIGSWFSYVNRITITQQEYRWAYQAQKHTDLKIIPFVRDVVWNLRSNPNGLREVIQKTNPALNFNESMETSEFICNFIQEINRTIEINATGSLENFPANNWIYKFSSFREIIDALQNQLFGNVFIVFI